LSTIIKKPNEVKQTVVKADPKTNYHAEYERVARQREGSLHVIDNAIKPNANSVVSVSEKPKAEIQKENAEPLKQPIPDREPANPLNVNNNESIDSAHIISLGIEQRHQIGIDTVDVATPMASEVEATIIEHDEPTVMMDETVNTFDTEYGFGDTEMALEPDDMAAPDFALTMNSYPSTEPLSHELVADLDVKVKLLLETETVETYFEIRDLIADSEANEVVSKEITEPEVGVFNEYKTENEPEPTATLTFETFINTQPVIEDFTLESIKKQNNKQPLEQTLVQLVERLAKTAEDHEQLGSIFIIIEDIGKALPNCYIGQEAEEVKLRITPRMADKLLMLLRELGYQNPREVLINMISKFGFEFLIQSLTYIYQLTHEGNRKEFLKISIPVSNSDDNSLSNLSKLILRLVMGKELLPESVAV
jgi:hypothetical protein